MDKSWIDMPRNTSQYMAGLNTFLDFAFSNSGVRGKIICPCQKCNFKKWQFREVVYEHLIVKPFPKGYTMWLLHGERRINEEKIEAYESTNTSSSQTKETSSSNSLALALGSQEHCGRVCGLGLGPCPSKLFGIHGHCHSGSSSTSPSYAELQTQVSSLTSQVNEMKAMMTFMLQNYPGQVPSRFNIFQPSPVFDQESMPNEEENEEQD
ncbi:uncharacterized protein LOC124834301 [Vigna umbellata]|uniref:uncharacterized protein LOC124834301 n=1 Tax=Vigna umbellata TaxID=87088 RepID=UPI001F5FA72D|nr:uncharacterized protein LOC124834301 [Vigna umbellata]